MSDEIKQIETENKPIEEDLFENDPLDKLMDTIEQEKKDKLEEKMKEPSMAELRQRPRFNKARARAKFKEKKEVILEWEDGSVIIFTIRKGLPAPVTDEAESVALKINPITQEADLDIGLYMMSVWEHLVLKSDPEITLADLKTFEGEYKSKIIVEIFNAYMEGKQTLAFKKKYMRS